MVLKLPWAQKRMWSFFKYGFHPMISQIRFSQYCKTSGLTGFHIICKYLSETNQIMYWNSKRKPENCWTQEFVMESFSKKSIWSGSTVQQCEMISTINNITFFLCFFTFFFFLEKQGKALTTVLIKSLL